MEDELFSAEMQSFSDGAPAPPEVNEDETNIENPVEENEAEIVPPVPESVDEDEPEELGQEREDVNKTNDTSSLLFSFASTLVDGGVLPSLDLSSTKINSTEDLIEAIKSEVESNELSDLNEYQKEALHAFRNGIPAEDFVKAKQQNLALDSITEDTLHSDVELRKNLIKNDFLAKGYSESRADKFVQRSLDLGEDIEDAKEALDSQKKLADATMRQKIAQNQADQAAREQKHQEDLNRLKEITYDEKKEVIPGIKYNKKLADSVYQSMTKIVDTVGGQPVNAVMKARAEDPVGFEHKLHYLFQLTKGFNDFSKVNKNAKSKMVKDFEDKLNLNNFSKKDKFQDTGKGEDLDFLDRMFS